MTVRRRENANGYLVYQNQRTGKVARVWKEDLEAAVEVCEVFDPDGERAPLHAFAEGDFSFRTLQAVLVELREIRDIINEDRLPVDGDDYIDLLTTIDDLEGVTMRIQRIA